MKTPLCRIDLGIIFTAGVLHRFNVAARMSPARNNLVLERWQNQQADGALQSNANDALQLARQLLINVGFAHIEIYDRDG
jgi:hypothetical protein